MRLSYWPLVFLTSIATMTILTLILPSFNLNTFSQTEIKNNTQPELAAKIQLVPHENEFLDNYYQVSDFVFVLSNSSQLCPSGNCKYKLEGGTMPAERIPDQRSLAGRITIDTGESKKVMELRASWKTVEEIEKNGENIKVINGVLELGISQFRPDNEYQINGTLSTAGDGYLLEIKGIR
jgi:hypothetical protein